MAHFPGLRLLIVCFILCTHCSLVCSIELQSATYDMHTANLLGNTYQYAIMEAQFDEEIYVMRQWTCGCVNMTVPCSLGPGDVQSVAVDETGYNIQSLVEGEWVSGTISNNIDVLHYKFELLYDVARPCPIILLEFNTDLGTLSMLVSNVEIPNTASRSWYTPYFGRGTYSICPSSPNMTYGAYYITMENQYGNVYNSFKLRYQIINSPSCLADFLDADIQADDLDSVWLSDGIEESGSVGEGESAYFRLVTPGPCTNVSASVYNWQSIADLDIFASATNPHPQPNDKTSYQWHGTVEGDDYVNFYYCNPDESVSFNILYFGVRAATPGINDFSIFATSQQWIAPAPLSEYGMVLFANVLSFGAAPVLTCSDRQYTCGFPAYVACDLDRAYECCYLFSPLAATDAVQAVWPWSEWDDSISTLASEIPWADSLPSRPGKLSWRLYLSRDSKRSDGSGYSETLSYSDPSTCTLELNSILVDSQGIALPSTPISFTAKPKTCDYQEFKNTRQRLNSLATNLVGQTDILQLGLLQSQLVIASLDPSISACEAHIASLTTTTTDFTETDVSFCPYLSGTTEWSEDPCCNPFLAVDTCCNAHPVLMPSSVTRTADTSKIKATCKSAACAEGAVTEWTQLNRANEDAQSGCAATFNKASSIDALNDLTRFVDECRIELVGEDLLGSRCSTSDDCLASASCDVYSGRCSHTDDDVIDCLANRMDGTTAAILFNTWGLSEIVTSARLISELNARIKATQCSGSSSSLKYRDGYYWASYFDTCSDQCSADGAAPFCFDRMSPSCVIPAYCDGAQETGACYRYWNALTSDSEKCLEERFCNWRDCPLTGNCQSACESPTPYTSHTCIDCSGLSGRCYQVDTIDSEAFCNLGLCSTNASSTSAAECLGACSIDCPTCNDDQLTCEAQGACSDASLILDALYAYNPSGNYDTGACLYHPLYDEISLEWICDGNNDFLVGLGCVNISIEAEGACATEWYQYATNEQECLDTSRYGCYDEKGEVWIEMNETACLACAASQSYVWKSMFEWSNGTWTDGTMKPLQWVPRTYYAPNVLTSTIDYSLLFSMIKSAVTTQFAFSYYTEAQCRYSVPLKLVEATLCDCTESGEKSATCFASANDVSMGQGRVCPFLASNFSTRIVTVHTEADSIPASTGCLAISLAFSSASQYQLDSTQEVSQALFRDTPTNSYWVVNNEHSAYIGQIISDGVKISEIPSNLGQNFTICIKAEPSIEIASVATQRIIAILNPITSHITPLSDSAFIDEEGKICGSIGQSGTYFAAAVVSDYGSQTNRVSVVQYRVGAAIYLTCFVFGVMQAILLLLDWERQRILSFKLTFIAIILLNCAIRTVYVLLPSNAFRNGLDSIQFIVFELPSFLFFSVFTVIMYMWLLVVMKAMLWARRGELAKRERRMRFGFILGNVIMYAVFVTFIFLIAILPNIQKQSPCFIGSRDSKSSSVNYRIKLGYWISQFVIVLLVSIGFIIGAFLLSRTFWNSSFGGGAAGGKQLRRRSARYSVQIAIISSVGIVCMVFMLIRAAIFLWAAKTGKSLNIIVFVVLEVIPQAMLLFYVHPFRCFREEGRTSTESRTNNVSAHSQQMSSVISNRSSSQSSQGF